MLGKKIKLVRLLRGMKQGQLAKKIKVASSTLSQKESGLREILASEVINIAGVLGVRAEIFFYPDSHFYKTLKELDSIKRVQLDLLWKTYTEQTDVK